KLADWAYQTLNKRRSDLIKSGTEEASEASDASDAPINNDVGATDEAAIDIETELDAGAPPTDIEMPIIPDTEEIDTNTESTEDIKTDPDTKSNTKTTTVTATPTTDRP
ncbi:hypothetical protein TI05_18750, partial [Achromatium sp. WMS3]